jgi:hypothetical protein
MILIHVYSPAGSVSPPSHLTSCTPIKCNVYFNTSLEILISEPALYRFLTFKVSKSRPFSSA